MLILNGHRKPNEIKGNIKKIFSYNILSICKCKLFHPEDFFILLNPSTKQDISFLLTPWDGEYLNF
jgi:hypothetical protein